MPTPDLNDIALFEAVAEAGGFRQAALRRGGSASSISDAIRRLEGDLGTRLFNRTTRSVTLTEAGQALRARLRPALAEIGAALDGAGAAAGEPVGTLRLNVPGIVGRFILPRIVPGFMAAHPGVRVDAAIQDEFVDVLAAGFDAGIRYEESLARDMIAVPIGPATQRFVAAAAPAYLERHGTPRHPRDLIDHARLIHRFPSGKLGVWELERGRERIRIVPEGPLVTGSTELLVAAAESGLGIICTFEEFLAPSLAAGRLVELLTDWPQRFTGPRLYFHDRRHLPPALRCFVDHVRAHGRWD